MLPYVPLQRIPASEFPAPECAATPDFGKVHLLLHCEGANNSTTFTDSSSFNRTVSIAAGTPVISTAQSKFGSGSLYSAAASPFRLLFSSVDSSGIHAGTLEFWFRRTRDAQRSGFLYSTNRTISLMGTGSGNTYQLQLIINGVRVGNTVSACPLNEWCHLAVSGSGEGGGAVTRLFFNGQLETTISGQNPFRHDITSFDIGRTDSAGFSGISGYIDEYVFTRGLSKYAESFTPPTLAFCDGGEDLTPVPAPSPAPPPAPPSGDQYRIAPVPRTLRVGAAISAQEIARVIGFGTSYFTGNTETMAGVTLEAAGLPPGVGSLALSVYSGANPAAILITASGTPTTVGEYRATVNLIRDSGIVGSFIWLATVIDPPVFEVNFELDDSTRVASLTVGIAADVLIASPTLDRAGEVTLAFVPPWIAAIGMTLELDWTSGAPGSGELRLSGTPTRALTRDELVSPGFLLGGNLLTTTSFRIRCVA